MSLKDDALEIRIDLRTCIGHIKNRVVQLEESKARINEQLNIHVVRRCVFYLQFFFNCFSPKVNSKNTSNNCKHNSIFSKPMFCSFNFCC